MLAFAVQCSPSFSAQFRILQASLKRFHPDWPLFVYSYDWFSPSGVVGFIMRGSSQNIMTDRPSIIRQMLGWYPRVCFLGADTELFAPLQMPDVLIDAGREIIVCPHLVGHDLRPQADFQVWARSDLTYAVLDWYETNLTRFPDEQHCLTAFPKDVQHLWPNRTHNIGYWNAEAYGLHEVNGQWFTSDGPLVLAHYSGFVSHQPERMSRHNNGPDATGDVLRFYARYARLINPSLARPRWA